MSRTAQNARLLDRAMADLDLPEALAAYRREWWRCQQWGYRMIATLPALPPELAQVARDNAFRTYWSPSCNADRKVNQRLHSDTLTAIEAAAAEHRAAKGKRKTSALIRTYLAERDGGDCWLCGEELADDATIEHKVPVSRGGTWAFANLVLAHVSCNRLLGTAPTHIKDAARAKLQDEWEQV